MVIIRLNLQKGAAPASIKGKPFLSSSASLGRIYFPAQGMAYSLLIHSGLFVGLFFVPLTPFSAEMLNPPPQATLDDVFDPLDVIYIPILPEIDSGMNEPVKRSQTPRNSERSKTRPIRQEPEPVKEEAPLAAASATEGLSYPGPQPILSDPPDPTNLIQTVLQPELENPAILIPPITLPNFVEMAYVAPPPMVEPPEPEMAPPEPVETPEPEAPPEPQPEAAKPPAPPVETPKPLPLPNLKLTPAAPPPTLPPASVPRETRKPEPPAKPAPQPKLEPERKTPPPAPQAASVAKDTAAPELQPKPPEQPKVEAQAQAAENPQKLSESEMAPMPTNGTDQINVLSLSPMPSPLEQNLMVPQGEARGRFAISPEPNLEASGTEPGLKSNVPPSPAVGIGNNPAASPGAAAAAIPPSSATVGFGQKSGPTRDTETTSATAGTASTAPAAASSNTAPKLNRSPFSGITVVGGVPPPRSAANSSVITPPRTVQPLQTSYGLTVISTENSGGGLPSFGVFSNQPIYTVYLDMRQTENDVHPSWTLEFAVISEPDKPANSADQSRSLQGLILPFPAVKESPVLPDELVLQHLGKMIIVYGVVGVGGGIEELSIKESPDARFEQPVLDVLRRWKFRAAQLNGESVSVKLLLGIPLWLPQ